MTPEEFKTGKRADGSTIGGGYIEDALKTLSPSWHGDKVSMAQFKGRLNGAIDAANKLDQVKKSLFYGRDNNLISEGQGDSTNYADKIGPNVVHGIIGIFTEAGELLEALRDSANNNVIDVVNIREEIGDLFWYVAILANEFGFTFEDAMRINIAKLKARFPASFEADYANNRDLAAERVILEDIETSGYADSWIDESATVTQDQFDKVLSLVPAIPASGPIAVAEATNQAKAAFDAVNNVGKSLEAPSLLIDPEAGKSIAERLAPMPSEKLAQENN